MSKANKRDREVAYVLDGHDTDRTSTLVRYRLEIERGVRRRVALELARLDIWTAETMDPDDEDALIESRVVDAEPVEALIAKLRAP